MSSGTRNWHDIPIQPLQSDEHNQVSIAEPAVRINNYSGLFADREAHERALRTLFASFYPGRYFKDHEHDHEHDTQAAA
jgi:hypothetical protein